MKTTMAHVWILCSCFFAVLVPHTSAQFTAYPAPSLGTVERYLYEQLEDALSNDGATLEQLREVLFRQPRPTKIQFHINITADSISDTNCSVCHPYPECELAFCRICERVSRHGNISTAYDQWNLCSNLVNVTWITYVNVVDLIEVLANTVVPWCAHGPSILIKTGIIADAFTGITTNVQNHLMPEEGYNFDFAESTRLHLLLKDLDCQPYTSQLTNAVGQLFTWIEVYAEADGKPQTLDPQQQAAVTKRITDGEVVWGPYRLSYIDNENIQRLLQIFGLVGCSLLTLFLSLLIPRLFLRYHNKLVISQKSSLGSRSLYWGTAIVSLFLALVILLGKLRLSSLYTYIYWNYLQVSKYSQFLLHFKLFVANLVVEILIPTVFLVISIIASKNSRPLPMPAAKFTTHVLFCCCCCFCCSSRCKSKAVQVLTLWAFMTVIYYNITEAFALVFTLFISLPLTVSYTLMYVSGVFFTIMLLSIILFSCQSTGYSRPTKCLRVVDVFITLLIFSFVILVFVALIAMSPLFSYVKGFEAVSLKFSVLPSLALSVAGWLIRKKLLKEDSNTTYGAIGHSLNDGEREGEEEQSAEEQQHLLA